MECTSSSSSCSQVKLITEGHPRWEELGTMVAALPDEIIIHIFSYLAAEPNHYLPTMYSLLAVNHRWANIALDHKLWTRIARHTVGLQCAWYDLSDKMPPFTISQRITAQMLLSMAHLAKVEWPTWGPGIDFPCSLAGDDIKDMYRHLTGPISEDNPVSRITLLDGDVLAKLFRAHTKIENAIATVNREDKEKASEPLLFDLVTQEQLHIIFDDLKAPVPEVPEEDDEDFDYLTSLAQKDPEPETAEEIDERFECLFSLGQLAVRKHSK